MAGWWTVGSPLDEVLESFQALLDERARAPSARDAGRGNFRCERCEGCSHCRFCNDCNDCNDCTYCEGCTDCESCTHCKHCDRCTQTTHTTWSSACKDSSYVTLCQDCIGCVQCFACVGLRNEEFCILNEKLPRKTYFTRVAELRGAIEARIATGWRPPWLAKAAELEPETLKEAEPEPAETIEEPVASVTVDEPAPSDSSTSLRLETLWANELPEPSSVRADPEVGGASIVFNPIRTEPTVDTGEPVEASRLRQLNSPWSFSDHRDHGSFGEDEVDPGSIPEPPPFGATDEGSSDGDAVPRRRPAIGDESTRRHGQAEPVRDRYGWSAQTEGTPASPGWRASELGPERERPVRSRVDESPRRWTGDLPTVTSAPQHRNFTEFERPFSRRSDFASRAPANRSGWKAEATLEPQPLPRWESEERERETRPILHRRPEGFLSAGWVEETSEQSDRDRPVRRPTPWSSTKTAELQAVDPDEAPTRQERWPRSQRERWPSDPSLSEPEHARMESESALDRRRRETAASPSALTIDERPRVHRELLSRIGEPQGPPREPGSPARSSSTREPSGLHPEGSELQRELDQWLPYDDARRSRLGPDEQTEPDAPVVRHSPVRAEISGTGRVASSRSGSVEWTDDRRSSGPRATPKNSLGLARRPERPRPPEPRERGALLRGRAPARPAATPANPRQSDAPSLRQARRPARIRDETTSKFQAASLIDIEPDPGTG